MSGLPVAPAGRRRPQPRRDRRPRAPAPVADLCHRSATPARARCSRATSRRTPRSRRAPSRDRRPQRDAELSAVRSSARCASTRPVVTDRYSRTVVASVSKRADHAGDGLGQPLELCLGVAEGAARAHAATRGTQHRSDPTIPLATVEQRQAWVLFDPRRDHSRRARHRLRPLGRAVRPIQRVGRPRRQRTTEIDLRQPRPHDRRHACGRAPRCPWPRRPSGTADRPPARARAPCHRAAPRRSTPSSTANSRSTTDASPIGPPASGVVGTRPTAPTSASRGSDSPPAAMWRQRRRRTPPTLQPRRRPLRGRSRARHRLTAPPAAGPAPPAIRGRRPPAGRRSGPPIAGTARPPTRARRACAATRAAAARRGRHPPRGARRAAPRGTSGRRRTDGRARPRTPRCAGSPQATTLPTPAASSPCTGRSTRSGGSPAPRGRPASSRIGRATRTRCQAVHR